MDQNWFGFPNPDPHRSQCGSTSLQLYVSVLHACIIPEIKGKSTGTGRVVKEKNAFSLSFLHARIVPVRRMFFDIIPT
jgi:hypothetical protein